MTSNDSRNLDTTAIFFADEDPRSRGGKPEGRGGPPRGGNDRPPRADEERRAFGDRPVRERAEGREEWSERGARMQNASRKPRPNTEGNPEGKPEGSSES